MEHFARKLIDTQGAAELIGVSPGTMVKWRLNGYGPRYHKKTCFDSPCGYDTNEVLRWILERMQLAYQDKKYARVRAEMLEGARCRYEAAMLAQHEKRKRRPLLLGA